MDHSFFVLAAEWPSNLPLVLWMVVPTLPMPMICVIAMDEIRVRITWQAVQRRAPGRSRMTHHVHSSDAKALKIAGAF